MNSLAGGELALGLDVLLAKSRVQVENHGYDSCGVLLCEEGAVKVGDEVAIGSNFGAGFESHCRDRCTEEARAVGESLTAPHDDDG